MNADRAIVVAGGRGQRLHLDQPKSSLEFEGHILIWWTVRFLFKAGFRDLELFVNDDQWAEHFRKQLREFVNIRINRDIGYSNTFLLFRENCGNAGRCLFAHGHAPRAPEQYSTLRRYQAPIVASIVDSTSMRMPLQSVGEKSLEPPFLIQIENVKLKGISTWHQFFEQNAQSVMIGPCLGPGEFNTERDMEAYFAYLMKICRID